MKAKQVTQKIQRKTKNTIGRGGCCFCLKYKVLVYVILLEL